ncbi:Ger(x)C family spore germination protein [Desulfotomaculum sp. 1211_IL3151]|uniref:Ger(x)C family spore germination protein n=1 Tax=Desulfotomaculum sp. 1211_IL3151 TaxID=3084055 RepID=UPI002FDB21BD
MGKHGNKILSMILLLLLLPQLCGCTGGRETDEVALVLAVGFDKGENSPLEMTVTIANPQSFAAGEGGGGGKAENYITANVEGPSIWECYLLFNTFGTRDISFVHTIAYIFSEELAKEGMDKYLHALLRQREVRRNSQILICRGTAKEFMKNNKPQLEASPNKQYQAMERLAGLTELSPSITLHKFYSTLKSLHSSPVASLVGTNTGEKKASKQKSPLLVPYVAGEVPQEGGSANAEFIGTAVFRDDQLVGELDGTETRLMLLMNGDFNISTFTLRDPKKPKDVIALRLRQAKKPDIKIVSDKEKLNIHQTIYMEGEFLSIQSGENYEGTKRKKIVEQAFNQQMQQLSQALIDKSRDHNWGDIFNYDLVYRKQVSTWEEWETLNWKEMYDTAEITVEYKTNIRRPGLMRTTNHIIRG